MQTLAWNQTHLNYEFHCVNSAKGVQLGLHRYYRHNSGEAGVSGTPVLLLPDFLEDAHVFFPNVDKSHINERAGLAPMLAAAGYDVYLLDLRGKGKSWPGFSTAQAWGLREAIMEDIPAHLSAVARLRPGCPQLWLGKGLGSVLFASCFARLDILPAPVRGMVHFAAGRRHLTESVGSSLKDLLWRAALSFGSLFSPRVSAGLLGDSGESRQLTREWLRWRQGPEWRDPADAFNYRLALHRKQLPPSLYFCSKASSSVAETRRWQEELGLHDAILLPLGRSVGNRHNYSPKSMLTHRDAPEDHLLTLLQWLQSVSAANPLPEKKLA